MLFEERVEHYSYNEKLHDIRRDIDSVILEFEDVQPTDKNVVQATKTDLIHLVRQYDTMSKEYESYT